MQGNPNEAGAWTNRLDAEFSSELRFWREKPMDKELASSQGYGFISDNGVLNTCEDWFLFSSAQDRSLGAYSGILNHRYRYTMHANSTRSRFYGAFL